ncbi:MAG: EF-hand domain-containing protein [Gammaproteobacteria bacterium]|nr:EF-hand domain-containing protein [Gammaproteobacteria bacterium]
MFKKSEIKPIAAAIGTVFATSTIFMAPASADENPFQMTELSSGYMVADGHEGKCGEGKCGEGKKMCKKKMKKMDTDGDGSVSKDEFMAHAEKKFSRKDKNGDGIISAEEMKRKKKNKEGKCGEGKCGEGKCGEKKSDS